MQRGFSRPNSRLRGSGGHLSRSTGPVVRCSPTNAVRFVPAVRCAGSTRPEERFTRPGVEDCQANAVRFLPAVRCSGVPAYEEWYRRTRSARIADRRPHSSAAKPTGTAYKVFESSPSSLLSCLLVSVVPWELQVFFFSSLESADRVFWAYTSGPAPPYEYRRAHWHSITRCLRAPTAPFAIYIAVGGPMRAPGDFSQLSGTY